MTNGFAPDTHYDSCYTCDGPFGGHVQGCPDAPGGPDFDALADEARL